eukprot:1140715-Pelagomonas_calceolata.AAC.11
MVLPAICFRQATWTCNSTVWLHSANAELNCLVLPDCCVMARWLLLACQTVRKVCEGEVIGQSTLLLGHGEVTAARLGRVHIATAQLIRATLICSTSLGLLSFLLPRELNKELARLITDGTVKARIDSHAGKGAMVCQCFVAYQGWL